MVKESAVFGTKMLGVSIGKWTVHPRHPITIVCFILAFLFLLPVILAGLLVLALLSLAAGIVLAPVWLVAWILGDVQVNVLLGGKKIKTSLKRNKKRL